MKKCLLMTLFAMGLSIPQVHAQRVIIDPGNFAGNITNSVREIATASETVKSTLSGFKEMGKLYNGAKKCYNALKQVNNLIDNAYKVKECVLMVGNILEICVISYKKMLADPNFRPTELTTMTAGYAKLLGLSDESLKELRSMAKSKAFSVDGSERIQVIGRIYTTLREYRSIVSYYTRKNISVNYIHAHEKSDLASVKVLYGNPENRYW